MEPKFEYPHVPEGSQKTGPCLQQPVALVCGVSGQDGCYLAKYLLDHGYKVFGTSRDASISTFTGLRKLGIRDQVQVVSMALNDFRSVLQVLAKLQPREIYNLAGQSSVGLSFEQPVETLESISIGMLNLLEAIRFLGSDVRLYNAGSSECFGDTGGVAATELTPFRPCSPYAVAKSAAFWQVASYREAYKLYACSGILFNHESPLRPERFVTQKIVRAACRIAAGTKEKLKLGNLRIERDWGWAPDYVEAMWRILQQDEPEDFVIATGITTPVRDFVKMAFEEVGISLQFTGTGKEEIGCVEACTNPLYQLPVGTEVVAVDEHYYRPTEVDLLIGDPTKAHTKLGWKPAYSLPMLVNEMVAADIHLMKMQLLLKDQGYLKTIA
jgi:GDPmannose 4,6-dehydratase